MTTIEKKDVSGMVLHKYLNGGYKITLHEDGTKIREQISNEPPITPESIDLKITNQCDLESICKWCHESSHTYGNHGNLTRVAKILSDLPAGAELAIGGGNALTHPDLIPFLSIMKSHGVICNLTVNQRHVNAYKDTLTTLIKDELVHGIGISKSGDKSVAWLYDLTDNIVFHVIVGINTVDEILMLPKTLVLGYKQKGRGANFMGATISVIHGIEKWRTDIVDLLGNNIISFDNLALEQLKIKKHITPEKWDEIYMGEDATFTYYIDAVKQRFGKSSTTDSPYGLMDSSADMLKYVRNLNEQ